MGTVRATQARLGTSRFNTAGKAWAQYLQHLRKRKITSKIYRDHLEKTAETFFISISRECLGTVRARQEGTQSTRKNIENIL